VPAALANGVMVGWLVGRRHVRGVMGAEVAANIVHILLDLWLVLGLHWGVVGVASASLMSEWLKLAMLVALCLQAGVVWPAAAVWQAGAFARLFALNRDLFLRTVLLTGAILEFTRHGAQAGAVTLAANGILFQMFMLSALILDGFETAAQVLCGERAGRGCGAVPRACAGQSALGLAGWGDGGAGLWAGRGRPVGQFQHRSGCARAAAAYLPWAVVLPVLGVSSFVMDGVFVGAGWARAMLGTMAVSFAAYNAALWMAGPWGNHGLWLAYCLLFVVRAGGQAVVMPV
jgi:MATE family multidrug resistance protein